MEDAIHLSTGSGTSARYPEDEVRAMITAGSLSEETLFWRKGMPDWLPIHHFPAPGSALPPPLPSELPVPSEFGEAPAALDASQEGRPLYRFVKDPTRLTRVLQALLVLFLLTIFANLCGDILQYQVANNEITEEIAHANDSRQQLLGVAYLLAFLFSAVPFLMWIHRANRNCHGFRARHMTFTPGWAVGWYFIPFFNLVRPYQVMKEILQISTSPRNWKNVYPGQLINAWWAAWLISGLLGRLSGNFANQINNPATLQSATIASIIAGLVSALTTLLALRLISTITNRQIRLVRGR